MNYIAITFLFICTLAAQAQDVACTLDEAIQRALEKYPSVEAARLETSRLSTLERTSFELPKTDIALLYGQYNSIQRGDNNVTISQSIPFPTVFAKQKSYNAAMTKSAMLQEVASRNELVFRVKQTFNQLLYLKSLHECLTQQDSLLTALLRVANVQYKTGESTLLALTTAEAQLMEIKNQALRNEADRQIVLDHLQRLCQSPSIHDVAGKLDTFAGVYSVDSLAIANNPSLALSKQHIKVVDAYRSVEVSRMMPDLRAGYFSQTLIGTQNVNGQDQYFDSHKRFQGFSIGLSVPLWFAPQTARVKAASIASVIAKKQDELLQLNIAQQYSDALQELTKNSNSVKYYREHALPAASLLALQSRQSFRSGEVDQATLLLTIKQVLVIREGYLNALLQYNQSLITIDYLTGKL